MKTKIVSLIALAVFGLGVSSFAQDSRDSQKDQKRQITQRGQSRQRGETSQNRQRDQRGQVIHQEQSAQTGQGSQREQDNKTFQDPRHNTQRPQDMQGNGRNNYSRDQESYQRKSRGMFPQEPDGIRHKDRKYHYSKGRYYDYNNRYIGMEPPIGYHFRSLPLGYRIIRDAAGLYYYYRGIFYIMNRDYNEYEVIDPPIGAIVFDLPYEAERVLIDGKICYQFNGTLYRRVNTRKGRAYRVVGKLSDNLNDEYDQY